MRRTRELTKVNRLRLPKNSSDKESCPTQLSQCPRCSPGKGTHWEFTLENHSAPTQPTEIS